MPAKQPDHITVLGDHGALQIASSPSGIFLECLGRVADADGLWFGERVVLMVSHERACDLLDALKNLIPADVQLAAERLRRALAGEARKQ